MIDRESPEGVTNTESNVTNDFCVAVALPPESALPADANGEPNATLAQPQRSEFGLDQLNSDQQERLTLILDEYLERLESGERPPIQSLLDAHPDLAAALRTYLRSIGVLHGVTRDLSGHGRGGSHHGHSLGRGLLSTCPSPVQLGDYRIVREIGRGGMGIVYEAQQLTLNRRVALKVLPLSGTLDAKQTARFRREAQAAAQLQHAHIVPVYDVGCDQGIHYYSMPLIEGSSLDAFIHEQQQAAIPTQPIGSTIDDDHPVKPIIASREDAIPLQILQSSAHIARVTRWLAQAAEALGHAHEIGIVHRDIKLSNLLLDRHDNVWITDFGLAHIASESRVTLAGELLGTLRYMSPEQARGSPLLDHRTDIYSLGMTCYELLTHHVAFAGSDRQQLLQKICCVEPTPPRRLNSAIPRDLETILQTALAKDPNDRYSSAAELLADVAAFRSGRPIRARRPTPVDCAVKWIGQHRAIASTIFVAMLLTLLTVGISSWMIAKRGRDVQRLFMESQAAGFSQLDFVEQLVTIDGAEPLAREMLTHSLQYYRGFVTESRNQSAMTKELATAYYRIGRITEQLGQSRDAEVAYRTACDLFATLANREQTTQSKIVRTLCENNLGLLAAQRNDYAQAESHYATAAAALTQLQQQSPANSPSHEALTCRDHLATVLANQGVLKRKTGDIAAARALLLQAVAMRRELQTSAPEDVLNQWNLATLYHNLCQIALDVADGDANTVADSVADADADVVFALVSDSTAREAMAIDYCQRAIELQQAILREHPGHPSETRARSDLALGWNNLGALFSRGQRFSDARQAFQAAVELGVQLVSIQPGVPRHRLDLAISYNNLAQSHAAVQHWAEAEAAFDSALETVLPLAGSIPNDIQVRSCLAGTLHNRALALQQNHKFAQAAASLAQARDHISAALTMAPAHGAYLALQARIEQADHACQSQLLRATP